MFSAVGLFLGLKSKTSHKQNVIYFQFYIRLPNFRLLNLLNIYFSKMKLNFRKMKLNFRELKLNFRKMN